MGGWARTSKHHRDGEQQINAEQYFDDLEYSVSWSKVVGDRILDTSSEKGKSACTYVDSVSRGQWL